MPGRSFRQLLGREAARAERAGPVALGEHIGVAGETFERLEMFWIAQIQLRRQFAVAGVELLVAEVRQMRAGDLEHIGAVLGECAGA